MWFHRSLLRSVSWFFLFAPLVACGGGDPSGPGGGGDGRGQVSDVEVTRR